MKTQQHFSLWPSPSVQALGLTLSVISLALALQARAGDENWDTRFNLPPDQGVNGTVNAVVVRGSNVYVGGYFTKAGTVSATNIARWDGSHWSALGNGVNGEVFAIAVHALNDTNVFVGGDFSRAGSVSANYIAKWNGATWSSLGSDPYNGTAGPVYAIATYGVGLETVFVGGWFAGAGSISANFVAKWTGSSWVALGTGVGGVVRALAIQDPYLFAGGDFTTAGSVNANHIAKCFLSGPTGWSSLDSGPVNGVNGVVRAIAVSVGTLYAGGDFTMFSSSGYGASHIGKWSGGSWSTLGEGVYNGVGNVVRALALSGTNLYVGGDFTDAGNVAASRIAKWNGSWSSLGRGADNSVRSLSLSGTNLYVGGSFVTAGGVNAHAAAICNSDGSSWSSLGGPGLGVNNDVYALAVSGSDLYAGGDFTVAGTAVGQRIARFGTDRWLALGRPTISNAVTAVSGSLPHLYVGGWCSSLGYVAEWTTVDPFGGWWTLGGGVNNVVHAIAGQYPAIYVGGDFTGGAPFNYILKWNGSAWSALGSGVDGPVNAVAVSGGDVYVGGEFWKAAGNVVNRIAKWNGSVWSALGSGVGGGWVYAVAVSGSDVYVGGNFTYAGSVSVTNIARWDGTNWSSLGAGVGGGVQPCVYAIAVHGTNVYVGGKFAKAGASAVTNLARWNGGSWSGLGSGVSGTNPVVYALAVSGNDLYVGGGFTIAGNNPSSHFGIWHEPAESPAPYLSARRTTTNTVCVWWPVPNASWQLEAATSLLGAWSARSYQTNGTNCIYIEPSPTGNNFYRLHRP